MGSSWSISSEVFRLDVHTTVDRSRLCIIGSNYDSFYNFAGVFPPVLRNVCDNAVRFRIYERDIGLVHAGNINSIADQFQ